MNSSTQSKVMLNEREAARLYGMSPSWFQVQRRLGAGPSYHKVGRAVRYRPEDLDNFFSGSKVIPVGQQK